MLGSKSKTYHPSGHGSYNARWRKDARRERAVARQKKLCESGDGKPLDWRQMLPKGKRGDSR
jgi:hypothetical protein